MKKRITTLFIAIILLSILITTVFITVIFKTSFYEQAKNNIQSNSKLIALNYNNSNGYDELTTLGLDNLRLTIISTSGNLIFDSGTDIAQADYSLNATEVKSAINTGSGESIHVSDANGYETYYYAIKLSDDNILITSIKLADLYTEYNQAVFTIIIVSLVLILLSGILSILFTKRIVQPIEAMAHNIDEIDKNIPYKELEPFVLSIKNQHLQKIENARIRQEFTANVSHELKTPLTSISGYAEMLENGMAKDEDIADFASKIHNEAGRLISLIGDIIKLSELDTPYSNTDFEIIDLFSLVENTVELLSFNAERASVNISAKGSACLVNGKRDMLEELIYNLCDNAIRYNNKDGSVTVSVFKSEGCPVLRVKDTGIGIPLELHERIFERFYRVDKSRSKETGGTGLGLAIVKHVAIHHNAKIKVVSQVGHGTQIDVIFPPVI
ncbi:MAG: ATP-binding protein [Eubacteriales bacterium]